MNRTLLCLLMTFAIAAGASAQFERNAPAPEISAVDIHGQRVSLSDLIAKEPYLVIVHFFTTADGEEVALQLRDLHKRYGADKLGIIALGLREDEAKLKDFADSLDIDYYIIDESSLDSPDYLGRITTLPLTLFVLSDPGRTIERVISGGGESKARLLRELAENLYRQEKPEAAQLVEEAVAAEPENTETRELKGFILADQGKLDEAQAEFGAIDSDAGAAHVALKKGDTAKAMEIATQSDDGYAKAIGASALMREGKLEEAETMLQGAPAADRPWQQSTVANTAGRIEQAQGNTDAALQKYDEAVALDALNIVALSNEAETLRARGEEGDLQKAQETLERAAAVRGDDQMVNIMLQQVVAEQKRANDIERRKVIQEQIEGLKKRYQELKSSGAQDHQDEWTSRPLVLALLPGNSNYVMLDRAGTATVIQRELEARLNSDGRVGVVEREMLDSLLQELQLGSSDLASADTQRRLGQVVSAGMLGFLDFARMGADVMVYLRLVDTETTGIIYQTSQKLDEAAPLAAVEALLGGVTDHVAKNSTLQGLLADVETEDAAIINLGKKHGVAPGQQFAVMAEGSPIEVGGRVIAHRQKPVAKFVVDAVEDDYAVGHITGKADGVSLTKEMKIKAIE